MVQKFDDDRRESFAKCLPTNRNFEMAQNSLVSPVETYHKRESRLRKPSWKRLCAEKSENGQRPAPKAHGRKCPVDKSTTDTKTRSDKYEREENSTQKPTKQAKEKQSVHCDRVQVDTSGTTNNKTKSTTDACAKNTVKASHPAGQSNSINTPAKTDKNNKHVCSVCSMVFSAASDLSKHGLVHGGEKPHQCNICGKGFARSNGLNYHLRTHARIKPHKCEQCDVGFTSSSNLKKHMLTHTDIKPHVCPTCSQAFQQKGNLKTHMRIHTGDKPHKCATCGKCFSSQSNLKAHTKVHTFEKPHQCTTCGKAFSHPTVLRNHQRTHTGEKPYMCSSCGKSFGHICTLQKHMLIHTGEKPHKCSVCGTAFRQSGQLQMHMYSHTGDRPHECSACGKKFSNKSKLKIHMSVHLGGKPHQCPVCGRSYRYTESLRQHTRSVHGKAQSFRCDTCGVDFATKHKHKVHTCMLYSAEESVHTCMTCGKTFPQSIELQEHTRAHHKHDKRTALKARTMSRWERDSELQAEPGFDTQPTGEDILHVCMTCGQAFTRAHYLKEHAKTHKQNDHMQEHRKVHHKHDKRTASKARTMSRCESDSEMQAEPEFDRQPKDEDSLHVCMTCGQAFTQAHYLEEHAKTHEQTDQPDDVTYTTESCLTWKTDQVPEGVYIIYDDEDSQDIDDTTRENFDHDIITEDTPCEDKLDAAIEIRSESPRSVTSFLADLAKQNSSIPPNKKTYPEGQSDSHLEMEKWSRVEMEVSQEANVKQETVVHAHEQMEYEENNQTKEVLILEDCVNTGEATVSSGNTNFEEVIHVEMRSGESAHEIIPTSENVTVTEADIVEEESNKGDAQVINPVNREIYTDTDKPAQQAEVTLTQSSRRVASNSTDCSKVAMVTSIKDACKQQKGINLSNDIEVHVKLKKAIGEDKPNCHAERIITEVPQKERGKGKCKRKTAVECASQRMTTRSSKQKKVECEASHLGKKIKKQLPKVKHDSTHKPHICETCGRGFRWANDLRNHRRTHTGERPYVCPTCGKSFSRSSQRRDHLRTHTGEKPHKCSHDNCSRAFVTSSNLKAHLFTHTNKKPFPCSRCDHSYRGADQLRRHMRTHTGEKPYICSYCGKGFTCNNYLKQHLMTHTGVKPYQCSTCGKRFTHQTVLKNHMRTHTGARPYQCKECNKSFRHICTLQKHTLIHTGEKPHKCETCGKCFRQSGQLQVHTLTHTGVKPFGCHLCDKRFISKQKLQKHSKRHPVVLDVVGTHECLTTEEVSLDASSTAGFVTNGEHVRVAERFQLSGEQGQETVYIVDITDT